MVQSTNGMTELMNGDVSDGSSKLGLSVREERLCGTGIVLPAVEPAFTCRELGGAGPSSHPEQQ